MSLINEALDQLEQRDPHATRELVSSRRDVVQEYSLVSDYRFRRYFGVAVLFGFFLALATVFFWMGGIAPTQSASSGNPVTGLTNSTESRSEFDATAKPSLPLDAEPVRLGAKLSSDSFGHRPELLTEQQAWGQAKALDEAMATRESRAITHLLMLASEALENDQLTQPKGLNALSLYQNVLAIEPQNHAAQMGIERVQQRYVDIVNEKMSQVSVAAGDVDQIQRMIEKAKTIGVADGITMAWGRELASIDAVQKLAVAPELRSTSEVESPRSMQSGIRVHQERSSSSVLSILKQVEQQQGDGDLLGAMTTLRQYLQVDPAAESLAVKLFDLSLAYSGIEAAQSVLDRYGHQSVYHDYMQAKIHYSNKDITQALQLLESSQLKNGPAKEKQVGLQAALLQQVKRYEEAKQLYRSLLTEHPNNTVYWLGLAVCADALGQFIQAKQAYTQVVDDHQLQRSVREFAQRRLQELPSQIEQNKQFVESGEW